MDVHCTTILEMLSLSFRIGPHAHPSYVDTHKLQVHNLSRWWMYSRVFTLEVNSSTPLSDRHLDFLAGSPWIPLGLYQSQWFEITTGAIGSANELLLCW